MPRGLAEQKERRAEGRGVPRGEACRGERRAEGRGVPKGEACTRERRAEGRGFGWEACSVFNCFKTIVEPTTQLDSWHSLISWEIDSV